MNRAILAIDVQPGFNPPATIIEGLNRLAGDYLTVATVFQQNEDTAPYRSFLGWQNPAGEESLVRTEHTFNKHGYNLPEELISYLKAKDVDEVVVTGGQIDACIIAAGFSLFNAGIKASLLPEFCYGDSWNNNKVTINMWEKSLGRVYYSQEELQGA